jgi:hypothetical protein
MKLFFFFLLIAVFSSEQALATMKLRPDEERPGNTNENDLGGTKAERKLRGRMGMMMKRGMMKRGMMKRGMMMKAERKLRGRMMRKGMMNMNMMRGGKMRMGMMMGRGRMRMGMMMAAPSSAPSPAPAS